MGWMDGVAYGWLGLQSPLWNLRSRRLGGSRQVVPVCPVDCLKSLLLVFRVVQGWRASNMGWGNGRRERCVHFIRRRNPPSNSGNGNVRRGSSHKLPSRFPPSFSCFGPLAWCAICCPPDSVMRYHSLAPILSFPPRPSARHMWRPRGPESPRLPIPTAPSAPSAPSGNRYYPPTLRPAGDGGG